MKVALFGSTGLIGKNVLKLLVRLDQVERVYCPVRRVPEPAETGILEGAAKVDFDVVDFEHVDKLREKFAGLDAAICCLGTTIKQAGSKPAQEKIDVRLPLSLAAVAKKAGGRHFLCVSAQGANSHSPFFYNRLKGMLEEGLTMMNFEALTLVRPSLLLGKHKDKRFGEELMQKIFGRHLAILPARIRPVFAEAVAAHLVASMLKPPFDHICASDGTKGKRIIYNRMLSSTKL
ncbi:NAD(P)H-binding protein [Fibrobacter sp. UWR2]|uniref:NAD(P)H-binding protein n=1 Tax=Fibrobacter sp. UWR2 TaxID=1964352 RepID=UPI000B525E60|nr:NAD(P)H-binding protein [Fibrobacter sp. UWR2]OWV02000.1 NAD-binding protein [Fibrobacter sp. UWR2]